jgi:GDP-mannose 6-dehydrogenase
MDIFSLDRKLNLSSYYLKPGFAFGGSCLPKDLRALLYRAKQVDLDVPVLSSILRSNKSQIDLAYNLIRKTGKNKIGLLGLSFKPDTDDLRESPLVSLTEYLIGKGYELKIYDKEVSLAKVFGSNKDYIEKAIPHISSLLTKDLTDVIDSSEVIIVGKVTDEFFHAIANIDTTKSIVDLVRISEELQNNKNYQGICW